MSRIRDVGIAPRFVAVTALAAAILLSVATVAPAGAASGGSPGRPVDHPSTGSGGNGNAFGHGNGNAYGHGGDDLPVVTDDVPVGSDGVVTEVDPDPGPAPAPATPRTPTVPGPAVHRSPPEHLPVVAAAVAGAGAVAPRLLAAGSAAAVDSEPDPELVVADAVAEPTEARVDDDDGRDVHTPLPMPIPVARGIGAWVVGAILLAGVAGFGLRYLTSAPSVRAARRSATRDPLTGLANRRLFDEILGRELHRSRRRAVPLSLLLVDLDGFKRVNDTRGHRAGDEVLRSVGEVIDDRVRASDLAARFGGDEFAVVLPECSLADAFAVAEALRVEVERVVGPDVTASIGVAAAPLDADDADDLLRAADAAMYDAKRAGRNRVARAGCPSVTAAPPA